MRHPLGSSGRPEPPDGDAEAERLAIELEQARAGLPSDDPLVHLAGQLRPALDQREASREDAKRRMLSTFNAGDDGGSEDAGTRDAPHYDVHTAQVDLGNGHSINLADVESIDPKRAAQVARSLEGLRAKDPHE